MYLWSRPFFSARTLTMNLYSLFDILQTLSLKIEIIFEKLELLIEGKILVAPKIINLGTGDRQFGFFLDNLAFSKKCPPRNSAIYTRKIVNKKSDCEKINSKLRFLFYFKVKQNKNL